MVLTFKSVDKTLVYVHTDENQRAVLFFGTDVCYLRTKNLNLKVFHCRRLKGVNGVVLSTDDYFYRNQRYIYFVYIVLYAF